MPSSPLVSIAIAAYNRAHLIGLTLDSLLRQTETDFEIVISDDHSTDETQQVCERYANANSRIRYVRNEERLGLARNCTRVLRMTCGEFVVLAGDDDIYEPDYLCRLLTVIRADPAIALVACRVDVIDQQGQFVRHVHQHYFLKPSRSPLRSANRMLWKGFGNLMTGMYRREQLARTGLFESVYRDYWDSVDLVFLFDVALAGDIVWIDEILLHKRAGGVSGQPVERSFFATVITFFAAWRSHLLRLWRSDPSIFTKAVLTVSIVFRMLMGLWQMRYAFGYSLLVNLDGTGRLRRRLRNRLPRAFIRRLETGG